LFSIRVVTNFQASHQLTLTDGSKEQLHNHKWQVSAQIERTKLNRMGLVMDFNRLRRMLKSIVANFNGTQMEEIDYFQRNNSSSENVAKYIYEKLEAKLPDELKLDYIEVTEEPGCSAKFMK